MGDTKLKGIYSNGLVLQRNKEIIIEGTDTSASEVVVTLAGSSVTAKVEGGAFKAVFSPMDAVFDTELKVEGTETLTVKDVCIGDVYMLTGQSNMELPVIRTYDLNKEEIEADCQHRQRRGQYSHQYEISAIGFYAAKRIFKEKNVPIGLILSAQGGSNIESWMCEEDLFETGTKEEQIAPFRGKGALKAYVDEGNKKTVAWRENTIDKDFSIEEALSEGVKIKMPCIIADEFFGSVWFVKEFDLDKQIEGECLLRLGDLIDADVTYVNGVEVGRTEYQYPPRKYRFDSSILKQGKNVIWVRLLIELGAGGFVPGHPYRLETSAGNIDLTGEWTMVVEKITEKFKPNMMAQNIPSALYYASLVTLKNISVSQIWWCQGESNADFPEGYDKKMILTFKKMREIFGEIPVVLVRIADYINPLKDTHIPDGWKKIQELQDLAPTYIENIKVVASPAPDPIHELHPQNKSGIGADVAKASMEF